MGATKSKNDALSLPVSTLEQLRCWLCKGYLSCAPIRLLPDGNSVCGRCLTPNDGAPIYRQLAFELALSNVIFPCRYQPYGCLQKPLFSHTSEHERSCNYKPFACPSLSATACSWRGSAHQVYHHFLQAHPSLMTSSAEFTLEIAQDKQQILMFPMDFIVGFAAFIIKYRYDSNTTYLNYDVSYVASTAMIATYKIRLINDLSSEINLKACKCLAYNPDMPKMQELSISKFLEALENPKLLKVEINLTVHKSDAKDARIQEPVKYEVLDTLRCKECHNYLTIPVFDTQSGPVCADCAALSNSALVQSKNEALLKIIAETNYPCRWRNCKFVGRGSFIRAHQLACKFYPYYCPHAHCKATLTLAHGLKSLPIHMSICHGYEFFSTRVAYKSLFTHSKQKVMVTTKNNEVVLIKHCVNDYAKFDTHTFTLENFKLKNASIVAKLHFEHSHCKLKSKTFTFGNFCKLSITRADLPTCFRVDEKMTVIIEML